MTTGVDGGCSGGWQSNFGNEYCFDTDEEKHSDARDACHNRDAELASIISDDECDYVAEHMSVSTVFTARRYASAVLAVVVCLSVCLSARLSQAGIELLRQQIGSRK